MFQKTVLDNGLTIITESINTFRSVSLGIWIKAGSRHEEPAEAGLAHFIEHVTFKGTPTRTPKQIALEIESVGGILNAMTDKEICCFYTKVLDTHLETAVDLLSDIVLNSTYPPEELEKEKKVILEEINMYEDDPDEVAIDKITEGLWPNNPLGRPTIGYKETVSAFTRDNILAYRKKYYHYGNIIVSAAGNVPHDQLVELVKKNFDKAHLPVEALGNPEIKPAADFPQLYINKPVEQIHFCLSTESYPRNADARYTLSVLSTILGGGMSSRLFQEIREKLGLVYGISTFGQSFKDTGMFGILAGTSPEYFKQVMELIRKEFDLISAELVSEQEIKNAKEQIKGHMVLGLESSNSRMNRIAEQEIYFGKYLSIEEIIEKIDAVNADGIKKMSAELFAPEKQALSVVGPVDKIK
jgi:predicted Zn-dependent peptidase